METHFPVFRPIRVLLNLWRFLFKIQTQPFNSFTATTLEFELSPRKEIKEARKRYRTRTFCRKSILIQLCKFVVDGKNAKVGQAKAIVR